jgi:prevent-host-death family protein
MQRIGIRQLKRRDLSRAIRRAQRGEELIVVDRGVPVARIVPIAQTGPPAAIKDLVDRGLLEYRAPFWKKTVKPIPLRPGKKTAVMYLREQGR